MHAGRIGRSEIKLAMIGYNKLIVLFIIIAQQVLTTAHVTEKRKYITVTNRPEIRAGPIIADQRKPIVFYEFVHILPMCKVFRTEKKICPYLFTSRSFRHSTR